MRRYSELQAFQQAVAEVTKTVTIEINPEDFNILKNSNYKLCFAKKVGNAEYNVVWQSYKDFLVTNVFSWTPQYQLFGSNTFEGNLTVVTSTNTVNIGLGETAVLDKNGMLGEPTTGGPEVSITMTNDYGPIHPGVNQLSTGILREVTSTPIYVAVDQAVQGNIELTPVEKILVWFEQNIETSTMFSDARSNAIEIDMTQTNIATRLYIDGEWTKP